MSNSITSGRFILACRIEGLGKASNDNTDGRYRWVTSRSALDAPDTVDPQNLYKDALQFWPSELGFTADFRGGDSNVGTQTFKFLGNSTLWEQVMRYQHGVVGQVGAEIEATDSYVDLDTSGLTGTTIFLEREAILLGTESGVLLSRYQADGAGDGARGVLGTTAKAHGAAAADDKECFSTCNELSGRTIELLRINQDASSAYDETVIWSGVLRTIRAPSPDQIVITADSAMSLLRGAKLMRQQWRGSVARVVFLGEDISMYHIDPTGMRQGTPTVPVPDAGYDGNRKIVISDGSVCGIAPYETVDTNPQSARIQITRPAAQMLPFGDSPVFGPFEQWPTVGTEVYEVLSSSDESVANAEVEAKNTLPLASNPGVLLLQVLLTTEKGGNHATYDTGIANLAGGIPASLVNVEQIERWTTRRFGSTDKHKYHLGQPSFHLGVEGEPEDLDEVVKRILAPYQAVLIQGEGGKLEVASFADSIPFRASNTITEAQILSPDVVITQDRRIQDAIDNIDIDYNSWPGKGPDLLHVQDAYNHLRKLPGWASELTIDMGGITSQQHARSLAEGMVILYHNPIPIITLETTRLANYWPGDVVSVTHPFIFGAAAVRSVTNAAMLVIGRTEVLDFNGHSIRYELAFVGALYTKTARIAPAARVSSYAGASSTINVVTNVFTSSTEGEGIFRRDVPDDTSLTDLWEVGDYIQICDEYGTVRAGNEAVEITAVADDQITVNAATIGGSTPVADDIIRISAYGNASTDQKSRFCFIANATNRLGVDDDGYDYTAGEADET